MSMSRPAIRRRARARARVRTRAAPVSASRRPSGASSTCGDHVPRPWRWIADRRPDRSRGRCGGWSNTTPIVRTTSSSRTLCALSSDGIGESFAGLAFGNDGLGLVLAGAFVLLLGWRLRKGPSACANELAWCAALGFWWAGLALSRDSATVRYVPLQARRLAHSSCWHRSRRDQRRNRSASTRGSFSVPHSRAARRSCC